MLHRSLAAYRPTPIKANIETIGLANDDNTGPRLEMDKYWYFSLAEEGKVWVADTSTRPLYGITVWFTPAHGLTRRTHLQVQPVEGMGEALKRAAKKIHAKGLSITDHDRIWLDATLFDIGLNRNVVMNRKGR